jgi:hypothetical protein
MTETKPRTGPSPEYIAHLRAMLFPNVPPAPPAPSAAELNREAQAHRAEEQWAERQANLTAYRRQQAIDAVWERTVQARAEDEARAAAGCHRGPGDPDWNDR